MELNVNKKVLLEMLGKTAKAVTGRANNPLLDGINIIVSENKLTIIGSDSSLVIKSSSNEIEQLEEGNIVIEPRIFGDIIRRLPEETVSLKTVENLLTIKSGKSEFNIAFQAGDDYPVFDDNIEGTQFSIDSSILKTAVKEVSFAAAVDETRPILKGVYLDYKDNNLNLVALDGYRLAKKSIYMEEDKEINAVVDAKSLAEITRLMTDGELINVNVTSNYIIFKFENTIIASRLLEGNYVKYDSLLPTEFVINAKVDRAELLSSLERASLMSEHNNKLVKLILENNNLNVSAKSQLGKVVEDLNIEVDGDTSLTIAFNARYLMDSIKALSATEINMRLSNSTSPCVIDGIDDESNKHLILPVRIV